MSRKNLSRMKRILAVSFLILFVGCPNEGFYQTDYVPPTTTPMDGSLEAGVYLGNDIVATRGQDVSIIAYFNMLESQIKTMSLTNPITSAMTQGDYVSTAKAGYLIQKEFQFTVPVDIALATYTIVLNVTDTNGKAYTDSLLITIKALPEVGNTAKYSWDIRTFAEWDQPAAAIPELSMFNVATTRALIDSLYAGFTGYIPYPILLQPQTYLTVGVDDTPVRCELEQGTGFCIVYEDWLVPVSDNDYDILYQVQPQTNGIILYASFITTADAADKTDFYFANLDPSFNEAVLKLYRKEKESCAAGLASYEQVGSAQTFPVSSPLRVNLWLDQKAVFRDSTGANCYDLKATVDFH